MDRFCAWSDIEFDDVDTRPTSHGDFYGGDDYGSRGVTICSNDQDDSSLGCDRYRQLACYADFYAGNEDEVTRGVTLTSTSKEDPPVENDDVAKGVTLSSIIDWDMNSTDPAKLEVPLEQTCFESMSDVAKDDMHFPSDSIAPELTQDICEHLALTTVKIVNASPPTVANKLISLLRDTVVAQIDKVNLEKFRIRAQVYVLDAWCDTKARIYLNNDDSVVEFQRRSGCTVAFNRMFQVAKEHLLDSGIDWPMTRIAPPLDYSMPDEALIPLFNIIEHCSGDESLLAEAASSLAIAARNPKLVAQLRTPCALSALQQLQQVTDFRVAYPTRQILACIR